MHLVPHVNALELVSILLVTVVSLNVFMSDLIMILYLLVVFLRH